ncbi:hypothetical protein G6N82_05075 [Altererythrobacter sp. BO-6]|uniref:hypothetical protein n=1 Tax=Altererythrobacter sp. BO-6 TaxID=2604537 RepID=UPI0013E1F9F5|nr:hypothetical protein [Altererythrobacter sp. BO-6]QIG53608.1 hypothetical protein G6N82_05075 [Altererythrobacter sp. BO-6]
MISRRSFVGSAAALSAGSAMLNSGTAMAKKAQAQHWPENPKMTSQFVEFDDPIEEFEAHFRIERDLVEHQGTALTWFYWMVYMVPGDRPPLPMLRYEGLEYSYFRKVADHTYRIHAHNISVPMSLETNDYMESMVNPLTGETIATPTNLLLNDPGTVHSPKGFRNVSSDGSRYTVPYRQFRLENGKMKLDSIRSAPPDWPLNHMESSIQEVDYDDFMDKSITSLATKSTGVYVFPYSKWMNMGDRPGHLLGYWDAYKIPSVQHFPDKFLSKLERDHPDLLEPRWDDFERPVSFEY